ncbi:hypothetical protein [Aliikangiella sp. G2MR2-5]|uniref:hypothetical protein n=1 Tax=Aliikangiella sp. G2MR2-5 TaxID=2788943 RepID=UPI0018AAF22F|nr:hypothetical protein [Aliikangiella sp. G2MR2-5]
MLEPDKVGLLKSGEDAGTQIKICKALLGENTYYLFMCSDFMEKNANIADHHF